MPLVWLLQGGLGLRLIQNLFVLNVVLRVELLLKRLEEDLGYLDGERKCPVITMCEVEEHAGLVMIRVSLHDSFEVALGHLTNLKETHNVPHGHFQ